MEKTQQTIWLNFQYHHETIVSNICQVKRLFLFLVRVFHPYIFTRLVRELG